MTQRQKKTIRRTTFVFGAIALFIPVTVSPGQGVEGNEACAGSACCREMNSICDGEGGGLLHYYTDIDGKCNMTKR